MKKTIIGSWTIYGIEVYENERKKLEELLKNNTITSSILHKVLHFPGPISIDCTNHKIYFWKTIGVTFNVNGHAPGKNFSFSIATLPAIEKVLRNWNLSDSEIGRKIKETLNLPQNVVANKKELLLVFKFF